MIKIDAKRFVTPFVIALLTFALSGCRQVTPESKGVIYVSIAPIKYIVEAIVGSDFMVEVLVPAGASPETFEPTPRQYIDLNECQVIMSVGLIDFEKAILSRLDDKSRLINLSNGVELIAGSCSHNYGSGDHNHGVDPHIWTSPIELQRMALNCYNAIAKLHPDSLQYGRNYATLQRSLEELDNRVTGAILASGVKSFIIYHPAYTYLARDYGLEQIAIENEGKQPSARRIGQIVERARNENITQLLYQQQFPSSVIDVVALDANATAVAVDPLSEDVIAHIDEFTSIITSR